MKINRSKQIKLAQKASTILRQLSTAFRAIAVDDQRLETLYMNRVKFSPDGGLITIYFFTDKGKEHFDQMLPVLILYKPSLRSAIAQILQSRYTPELLFAYDEAFEKQQRVEDLIDSLKEQGKL